MRASMNRGELTALSCVPSSPPAPPKKHHQYTPSCACLSASDSVIPGDRPLLPTSPRHMSFLGEPMPLWLFSILQKLFQKQKSMYSPKHIPCLKFQGGSLASRFILKPQ